jgi:transposase
VSEPKKQADQIVSTAQAAKTYGVSDRTIRNWIYDGRFGSDELAPRKGRNHKIIQATSTGTTTTAA